MSSQVNGGLCWFRRLAQQLVSNVEEKDVACCIRVSCNLLLIYMLHEVDNVASPRMGSVEIHQKIVCLSVTVLVLGPLWF